MARKEILCMFTLAYEFQLHALVYSRSAYKMHYKTYTVCKFN